MNELTTINLTNDEAIQFVTFQKHRALIGLLEEIKAFELRNGSVTIHFDTYGRIRLVEKNESMRI